jgi:hypothetical protein
MSHGRKPSGAVTAAAVLMFLYAPLLLACGFCSGGAEVMPTDTNNPAGFQRAQLQAALDVQAPGHRAVAIAVPAVRILAGVTLLVCGFGVLRLVATARAAACAACGADLLAALGNAAYQVLVVYPVQDQFTGQAQWGNFYPQLTALVGGAARAGALLVSAGVPLLASTAILILLNVRPARAAFAGTVEDAPRRST